MSFNLVVREPSASCFLSFSYYPLFFGESFVHACALFNHAYTYAYRMCMR